MTEFVGDNIENVDFSNRKIEIIVDIFNNKGGFNFEVQLL